MADMTTSAQLDTMRRLENALPVPKGEEFAWLTRHRVAVRHLLQDGTTTQVATYLRILPAQLEQWLRDQEARAREGVEGEPEPEEDPPIEQDGARFTVLPVGEAKQAVGEARPQATRSKARLWSDIPAGNTREGKRLEVRKARGAWLTEHEEALLADWGRLNQTDFARRWGFNHPSTAAYIMRSAFGDRLAERPARVARRKAEGEEPEQAAQTPAPPPPSAERPDFLETLRSELADLHVRRAEIERVQDALRVVIMYFERRS